MESETSLNQDEARQYVFDDGFWCGRQDRDRDPEVDQYKNPHNGLTQTDPNHWKKAVWDDGYSKGYADE